MSDINFKVIQNEMLKSALFNFVGELLVLMAVSMKTLVVRNVRSCSLVLVVSHDNCAGLC
jgi:hypothetical protein